MSPAVEDYGEKKYLEGAMEKQVKDIRKMMKNLDVDSSKAMDILEIPNEERRLVLEALKQSN